MKKCAYCGRENVDEATTCSECGLQEFKQTPHSGNPRSPKHFFLRLLVASGVWVAVSGISLYVAWLQGNHFAWFRLQETQRALTDMDKAITAYQTKFKADPTNFEQLASMTNAVPGVAEWSWAGFTDGWSHPFVFSRDGTNCMIISYGRDGKPGGKGIDCDLTSKNPYTKESSPTFSQFFGNDEMRGMVGWSFACGGLAALLSFLTVRIPNLDKHGLIRLGLSLAATLIGAIGIASVITALHIPSGH